VEGKIIVQSNIFYAKVSNLDSASGVTRSSKARWPNGIVFYHVKESSFSTTELSLIIDAMKHIQDRTAKCVQFIETTNLLEAHVLIKTGDTCASTVGRSVKIAHT
jgi:hypothetical protein